MAVQTSALNTESFTCYHWLPRVLPELQRDFPHVDVRIVIEATEQPVAALLRDARVGIEERVEVLELEQWDGHLVWCGVSSPSEA